MEEPTGLQSGATYSKFAFDQLVLDGVIESKDVTDQYDLSELAEVVTDVTGSQFALTSRLPIRAWQLAQPNKGHMAAAALLMEGAVRNIVTLNYDLAFQSAMVNLGMGDADVGIIRGPEDHSRMTNRNLIFLHRSAESDETSLVLRKTDLDEAWKDQWEQIIASNALASPVTVFVGLGSPAAVLTESVAFLTKIVQVKCYLVGPSGGGGDFAAALGDSAESITQGWCDFALELSGRLAMQHVQQVREEAEKLAREEGLSWNSTDSRVIQALAQLNLVELGTSRGRWLLRGAKYVESSPHITPQLADLSLGLDSLAQLLDSKVAVESNSEVRLRAACSGKEYRLRLAHGGGTKSWETVCDRLKFEDAGSSETPRTVLVSGLRSDKGAPPDGLIRPADPSDLVRGANELTSIDLHDLQRGALDVEQVMERLVS